MLGKDLTEIEKPHKGTIKGWKINNLTDRPTVQGYVYGNPEFKHGEAIITSYIVDIQGDQLETRNFRYTLEDMPDVPAE